MAKIKLTNQQIQYIAATVIGLGALGFVYVKFFWMPISERIAALEAQIAENAAKIEKAQSVANRLPAIKKELEDLNRQTAEMEMQLPKSKSVPDILVTLSKLAEKHGVDISAFTPGSKRDQQYFTEWSYPITLQGRYHNIGKFLAAVALEQRIYNVQNVSFSALGVDGRLPVSFTLVAYQYKG